MQIAGMVMNNEDRDWVLDSEGIKSCEICGEMSYKEEWIHGICKACHDNDNSQCEGCYQSEVR